MLGKIFYSFRRRFLGEPPALVGVVRLVGPIGTGTRLSSSISFQSTVRQIEGAFDLPGVRAVALVINSPGGSPVQSALILQRIRILAQEKDIPVLAFTEDVAASGGYMLALAGDEIFVHEASIIGSIGVVSGGFGFPELMQKLGVERRLYHAGDNKVRLDPFSPEKEDDKQWLAGLQNQIHEYFKSVVRERRGKRLKGKRADLFNGDVWLGPEAVKLGLVDDVGEVKTVLRERFGKKVRIRVMQPRTTRLSSMLGLRSADSPDLPPAAGFAHGLLDALETRSLWQRYGL